MVFYMFVCDQFLEDGAKNPTSAGFVRLNYIQNWCLKAGFGQGALIRDDNCVTHWLDSILVVKALS